MDMAGDSWPLTSSHSTFEAPPDYPQIIDHLWTQNSALFRAIHSSQLPELAVRTSFPLLARKPRPQRPTTASPSLSSTVITLQSTPTQHTCGSSVESVGVRGRSELSEWISTKRHFESVRRAKRLPRYVGSNRSSSDGQMGLWEVYAAVFDPPRDDVGAIMEEIGAAARKKVEDEEEHVTGRGSEDARRGNDNHPTSSFSLSNFDFPVPPNHDNWVGTSGIRSSITHMQQIFALTHI